MAGFFDSITNLFSSSDSTPSAGIPTPVLRPEVQGASIPPNYAYNAASGNYTLSSPASEKSFFSGFGDAFSGFADTISKVGSTASNAYTQVLTAKSNLNQAQLANDLEKLRNTAILNTARNAPQVAQAGLPTVAQGIQNPQGAASSVAPVVLSGGFGQYIPTTPTGIGSTALMAALAVVAFVALRNK